MQVAVTPVCPTKVFVHLFFNSLLFFKTPASLHIALELGQKHVAPLPNIHITLELGQEHLTPLLKTAIPLLKPWPIRPRMIKESVALQLLLRIAIYCFYVSVLRVLQTTLITLMSVLLTWLVQHAGRLTFRFYSNVQTVFKPHYHYLPVGSI